MGITISGATGIDMGDKPISNVSQIDSTVINENGDNITTISDLNTAGIALKTIATGTATFDAVTNSVIFSGLSIEEIENFAHVEIGDVLQYSNATDTKNNSEFTIEVLTQKWANGVAITAGQQRKSVATNITYTALTSGTTNGTDATNDIGVNWEVATSETIIVNQAHANRGTTKNVAARTGDTGVTVKLLAKWYNATIGLGQAPLIFTTGRVIGVAYQNNTNRTISALVYMAAGTGGATITGGGGSVPANAAGTAYAIIPKDTSYSLSGASVIYRWEEVR